MPTLKGLMVDLSTASNEDDTGTDDEIYIGFWGTGGGREFPLSSAEHEDFAKGAQDRYILGVEPFIVPTAAVRPDRSEPGGANDPAALAVELSTIEYVYIRKQETRDNDDDPEDDAYKLLFVQVLLYEGPAALGTRSSFSTCGR